MKYSVLNEFFFFQKHYWGQHQEWSRNAIIPKVSVKMELKCKQKQLKINYAGNKIHLIVFKSEYKQMQWLSYKHENMKTSIIEYSQVNAPNWKWLDARHLKVCLSCFSRLPFNWDHHHVFSFPFVLFFNRDHHQPSCFFFCLVFLFHWNLFLPGLPHCFPQTAVGKQSWTGGIF